MRKFHIIVDTLRLYLSIWAHSFISTKHLAPAQVGTLLLSAFAASGPIYGFQIDQTTSGAWTTKYGAFGYSIPEGPSQMNYPSAGVDGAQPWVWTRVTALGQAPQYPFTRGGIASCWYSDTSFMVTVLFPDRNTAPVAFYFLDWDQQHRVQNVEILDSFGRPKAQVELRDFENGKYLVIGTGEAAGLRVTRVAGPNAVLSGIFVGGPFVGSALGTPPTISPNGGDFGAAVSVELFAPTADSHPYFTLNGGDPSVNGMAYAGPIHLSETTTIRAIARSRYGQGPEAQATFTRTAPPARADFLGEDRTVRGSWMGNYGHDGNFITMFPTTIPGANTEGASSWVWNWSNSDESALQKPPTPRERIAACWYADESFDIRVPVGQNNTRTVSVYALDWDRGGRTEAIDVIDAQTLLVIDSQQVSNFSDGVYLRWRIGNDVILRVRRLAGANAVVSGVFLDPSSLERIPAPSIIAGGATGEAWTVELGTPTPGAVIRYTLDGSTPTESSTLYTGPFQLTSDVLVSAVAFKEGMLPSEVSSKFLSARGPGPTEASADFVAEDSAMHGTWRGTYGQGGYWLAADATFLPYPVAAQVFAAQEHVWAFNVDDTAALQKATTDERLAACRYAPEAFTAVVDAGATPRNVSFYFLDWDEGSRSERLDLVDERGNVLDSRTVSSFSEGKYLTWQIAGKVTVQITRLEGANAVLSGIFFGPE